MGLESMNFVFRSDESFERELKSRTDIILSDNEYIYKKDKLFWIEMQIQDINTLHLRFMLSNPEEPLFSALNDILGVLFKLKGAALKELRSSKI